MASLGPSFPPAGGLFTCLSAFVLRLLWLTPIDDLRLSCDPVTSQISQCSSHSSMLDMKLSKKLACSSIEEIVISETSIPTTGEVQLGFLSQLYATLIGYTECRLLLFPPLSGRPLSESRSTLCMTASECRNGNHDAHSPRHETKVLFTPVMHG